MDSMWLLDYLKKAKEKVDKQVRVNRMRSVLDGLGVAHQRLSDDQLHEWMGKIDLTPQLPTATPIVRSQVKPPPMIILAKPDAPDVRQALLGLAEKYPITIAALEDILIKCKQDLSKLETVLILMAMLFKSDEEVLDRYDVYIKTYENAIAKAKH